MDFASDEPTSPRRGWVAVGVATVIGAFSYFSLIDAFVAAADGLDQDVVALSVFFGLVTAPFAFIAAAFISRHRSAPLAVLGAMGLFLLVGLPVGLLTPALGLVAGFGAGAVVAFRREEEAHSLVVRSVAVALAVVYTLVIMVIAVPLGVFTGGFIPFLAVGFADVYSQRRAEEQHETLRDGSTPRDPQDSTN